MLKIRLKKSIGIFVVILMIATVSLSGCSNHSNTSVVSSPTSSINVTTTTTSNQSTTLPTVFYYSYQAPIDISQLSDGQILGVNLVKFLGSIPSPDARVTVNNIPATVNSDGSYYVYLDLVPGNNIIQINTTTNMITTSKQITVTFNPPLAVVMDWPQIDPSADYTKTPLTIHGTVSNPAASVKVNNHGVTVGTNGEFTTQIQLAVGDKGVKADAVFGDETDTFSLLFLIDNKGVVNAVPGQSVMNSSGMNFSDSSMEVTPGGNTKIDFYLQANKDIDIKGTNCRVTIFRKSKIDGDTLPMLPSFSFNSIPSSDFTIYPKIQYNCSIDVQTSLDIVPSIYYFLISIDTGAFRTEHWITINVKSDSK